MEVFSLVVMIAAVIGVVVMILLFERKRAEGVRRDLRARDGTAPPTDDPERLR
jgi:hypothetical protein